MDDAAPVASWPRLLALTPALPPTPRPARPPAAPPPALSQPLRPPLALEHPRLAGQRLALGLLVERHLQRQAIRDRQLRQPLLGSNLRSPLDDAIEGRVRLNPLHRLPERTARPGRRVRPRQD